MASETTTGSNIEIVREYTEKGLQPAQSRPGCEVPSAGVTWHGQTLGTIKGADNVTGMPGVEVDAAS